jgi:hypothetical protein
MAACSLFILARYLLVALILDVLANTVAIIEYILDIVRSWYIVYVLHFLLLYKILIGKI